MRNSPTPSAAEFVPSASSLRELGAGLATKSSFAAEVWDAFCSNGLDTNAHELMAFLYGNIAHQHLARFVHRLQRRSAGLSDDWASFLHARGQQNLDPHSTDPRLLLQFVCWAITCAPDRVAALKGPFDPFMEVAVEASRCRMMSRVEACPPLNSSAEPAEIAEQLRAVLGVPCQGPLWSSPLVQAAEVVGARARTDVRGAARAGNTSVDGNGTQAEAARPVDLKDDSTMSGSLASKSDRSDTASSDNEGDVLNSAEIAPCAAHVSRKLESEEQASKHTTSATLWLGPEPPDSPRG